MTEFATVWQLRATARWLRRLIISLFSSVLWMIVISSDSDKASSRGDRLAEGFFADFSFFWGWYLVSTRWQGFMSGPRGSLAAHQVLFLPRQCHKGLHLFMSSLPVILFLRTLSGQRWEGQADDGGWNCWWRRQWVKALLTWQLMVTRGTDWVCEPKAIL